MEKIKKKSDESLLRFIAPSDVSNNVMRERYSMQISLAYKKGIWQQNYRK